jgi:hypothetical protein
LKFFLFWYFSATFLKCCTLTKTQISSLVLNIFFFGFVLIKCPEICYKEQKKFKFFGHFLTSNFASQNKQNI